MVFDTCLLSTHAHPPTPPQPPTHTHVLQVLPGNPATNFHSSRQAMHVSTACTARASLTTSAPGPISARLLSANNEALTEYRHIHSTWVMVMRAQCHKKGKESQKGKDRQARTCVMTRASTERAKADMYCSNTASGTTRAISLCAYGSWSCVCVCVCVCVCACVWPRAYVTTLCWTRASHHNIISS